MQQEKLTGKTRPGDGKNNKAKNLSVMTLLVKLMTDPTYQRRRWEMRNFRAYVVCISGCNLPLSVGIV